MYLQQLFSFQTWGHSPALVVPAAPSAYGRRAISYLGPKLWNKMPKALKEATSTEQFKSKLKTYLFRLSDYDIGELCKGLD